MFIGISMIEKWDEQGKKTEVFPKVHVVYDPDEDKNYDEATCRRLGVILQDIAKVYLNFALTPGALNYSLPFHGLVVEAWRKAAFRADEIKEGMP